MILDKIEIEIEKSNSNISFETTGDQRPWDRYLTIGGEKIYHIGNVCDTCEFFFTRIEGSAKNINPKNITKKVNNGISTLDLKVIDSLKKIFPKGKYQVLLSQIQPKLVKLQSQNDYFCNEQSKLWEIDPMVGKPHSTKTEYYRLNTKKLEESNGLFEFLIPMFSQNQLDKKCVEEYINKIANDHKPTAIALSVLDIKQPCDWEEMNEDIKTHWCLAHYLIDGHHKVYAATKKSTPITLISFLTIDKGISLKEDIDSLLQQMNTA